MAAISSSYRLAAAQRLGTSPKDTRQQAAVALQKLSQDETATVRAAALLSLGHLAHEGSLSHVVACLVDEDPRVREVAVSTIGQIGGTGAELALRSSLSSPHPEVRYQAVSALAEAAPARAAADLLALVDDSDAGVRANTARALGALGDEQAIGPLVDCLPDTVEDVRNEAALALARFGDNRALPTLRRALGTREHAIEAAIALGDLKSEQSREDLAALTRRRFFGSAHLRAAAAAALSHLGDPRGTEALGQILRAWSSEARGFAVELVGRYQLVAFVDELNLLVRTPRSVDRATLLEALSQLAPCSDEATKILESLGDQGASRPE